MRIVFLAILFCCSQLVHGQSFLHAKGSMIVDGDGKEVRFRGMGLGGWMLQEPYMLGLSGATYAQHDLRKKIVSLIGETNTKKFYEAWLNNHCTKRDIDSLAAWGFNAVRLPMHYNLYTLPVEKEPVKGKQTWIEKGFQLTDSLLSWCAANHIYLILDLHAVPGGQGNDNAIADRDTTKKSLWDDEANRQKTIALWKKLASRYASSSWIAGYDIINEPNWGFTEEAGRNGCNEKENIPLRALMKDITTAIREVDSKHIIFIEGNCWGNNYEGIFPLWDNNLVMSFHKYWNYNDRASIQKYIDYRDKYQVPIWLGETGENSNAWFTDVISMIEENHIGWTMWPMKKSGLNNLLEIKIDPETRAVFDYWRGKAKKPDAKKAFDALMRYAGNTNINKNVIRYDVIDAMNRQVSSASTRPYRNHVISPGSILYAVDYDLGRSGSAYHDSDSAEYWVSTNQRTGWNQGGQYRNDGVDIEVCNDAITNGYNIGWIEQNEWINYTIFSPQSEVYDVEVRNSAAEKPGKFQLSVNGEGKEVEVPVTGKHQAWQSTMVKNVTLEKGWNTIRLKATEGGFNLNYFKFNTASH